MKYSWTLGAALVLGVALLLPQTGSAADYYKREGGQAFHVRRNCPALEGYKVETIHNTHGLRPCLTCDAEDARRQQAEMEAAARANANKSKDSQPPKTLQEMSGTAYEKETPNKPEQNAQVKYPPNWEDSNNRLHADPNGAFVVDNGQKVYVNNGTHNAGTPGGGARPAAGRRR